ncbi:membrane protein [Terrabacter ginsenosidimutans]|uniref:Membrane protein n=1 Tax=Terrabacter ginsenosidimutans TaxID=490575 RepID=A0ABP7E4I3_9MICO
MTRSAGLGKQWLAGDPLAPAAVRTSAARLPRLVLLTWAALFLNVLPPGGSATVLPIPYAVGQGLAQGSLVLALLFALLANPRLVVRPTLFLVLLTVMAVVALAVSLHSEFFVGSTYRGVRLVGFVTCLWLLTPWWGRADLVLLRCHRVCLGVIIASVVVGMALSPGKAFSTNGRLGGTLWPIPPTQVAHYGATLLGTTAILWMCRIITGRHALLLILVTSGVLVGTHTRTALLGLVIGLAVAGGSLFLGHARVRRTAGAALVAGLLAAALFARPVIDWLSRGQSAEDAAQLTGRTKVWDSVSQTGRSLAQEVFGNGLSNKSFDGLPVDSGWVATFVDLGWLGIVIQTSLLLLLLLMAITRVRGPRRALALFLILYCVVASITETGLGDASPYLLDLVVAASLLVTEPRRASWRTVAGKEMNVQTGQSGSFSQRRRMAGSQRVDFADTRTGGPPGT